MFEVSAKESIVLWFKIILFPGAVAFEGFNLRVPKNPWVKEYWTVEEVAMHGLFWSGNRF